MGFELSDGNPMAGHRTDGHAMMDLNGGRIYIYRPPVDLRKAINGLSLLVQEVLHLELFAEHWFVFTNRHRNRVKILYWHRNGFCLWMKRLEQERFIWPKADEEVVILSEQQLHWLLDGYNINALKPHQRLAYQHV